MGCAERAGLAGRQLELQSKANHAGWLPHMLRWCQTFINGTMCNAQEWMDDSQRREAEFPTLSGSGASARPVGAWGGGLAAKLRAAAPGMCKNVAQKLKTVPGNSVAGCWGGGLAAKLRAPRLVCASL